MAITTLSPDYEITIPKDVADQLRWRPGQELAFVLEDDGVILMAVHEFEKLFGIASGLNVEDYRDRNDRY